MLQLNCTREGPVKASKIESWINWKARAIVDETRFEAQSFIVRVWVEEHPEEAGLGVWRGHITHVPTGRHRYLKNLDQIRDFIAPYLEIMGVKLGMRWRMRRWLRRLRGRE